jgi:hypothetical protein
MTATVVPTHRLLTAATALAAAAGVGLGVALAPDEPAEPRIGLRSGAAQLPLPTGWRPLHHQSSLPGFEQATAVRGVDAEVALDIRPPEHPSLLPADVAAAGMPEPEPLRLGARTVWRYELPGPDTGTRVGAFALPTTGGVVTVACEASPAVFDAAVSECERAVQAVQLDGASALAPTPETAAAIVLPEALARLNRSRVEERRRLAATRSPRARGAAADRLAHAYTAAAGRLRPLAAGEALRVTGALDALSRRHRALATASRQRRAAAARRSGAAIERGERRLGALLAALAERAQLRSRNAG